MACPFGPGRRPWRETLSALAVSPSDGTLQITPPTFDPIAITEEATNFPEGTSQALYQVPSSGLSQEERHRALREATEILQEFASNKFGYMVSCDFQCPHFESQLTSINTVVCGNPFKENHMVLPKWIEQNVLDYFASLWNAKWPHDPEDPDSYWGYVLTMGSSEGNLHALWSARNYLTTDLPNTPNGCAAQPVLLSSQCANFFFFFFFF